jgi:cytochrome c oxidase subunit IV
MDAEQPHVSSYGQLLAVLLGLLALTAATILLSRVDVGALNIWVTLLIAAAKSSLVLMFFMHLRYESRAFAGTLLVTVFFVAIFIGFMFWDVAFRAAPG